MDMKKALVDFHERNTRLLPWIHYIIIALTICSFVIWVLPFNITYFNPEAAFTVLLILSTSFGGVYKLLYSEAEYSPAYALAYGYVENFLEPTITQLIENGESPKFIIFRPDSLDALTEKNVKRIRGTIKAGEFELQDLVLESSSARSRDIILIEKKSGEQLYFDIPNTLISLNPYIEYKISAKDNESDEEKKKALGEKLIEKFFIKVQQLSIKKNIWQYIRFVDDVSRVGE